MDFLEGSSNHNKTKIVKKILLDLGFVIENPPKGWKNIVDEHLILLGVDPKKVNTYAIRLALIDKPNNIVDSNVENVVSRSLEFIGDEPMLRTLDLLLEVKVIMEKFGGKAGVIKCMDTIENLLNKIS